MLIPPLADQNVTPNADQNSTFRLQFGGDQSSPGSTLTYLTGFSPTAADVFQALQTIPALFDSLHGVSNIQVTGNPGGPFDITFINALGAKPIATGATGPISVVPFSVPIGGTISGAVTVPTPGQAPLPLATTVRDNINEILSHIVGGLSSTPNVNVIGPAGGPFLIAFNGGVSGYNIPTGTGLGQAASTNGGGSELQTLTLSLGTGSFDFGPPGGGSGAPSAPLPPRAPDVPPQQQLTSFYGDGRVRDYLRFPIPT